MRRTYRYRLYPTRRQAAAHEAQLADACALYNAALEQRRSMWRDRRVSVSYGDQSAELRELRAAGLIDGGANFWSQQAVLRRLDRAFAAFFRRVRAGEKPGYPRFKSVRRFDTLEFSFAGNAGGIALTEVGRLRLQGVGHVKIKLHRPIPAGRSCARRASAVAAAAGTFRSRSPGSRPGRARRRAEASNSTWVSPLVLRPATAS